MAYKTVLSILTDSATLKQTLVSAVTFAARNDAHLEALCVGIDPTQVGYFYPGISTAMLQATISQADATAEALRLAATTYLEQQDVRWSVEHAVAQMGALPDLIAQRARFSDLVVQTRPYGAGTKPEAAAMIEAALFDGHAPVLIAPDSGLSAKPMARVVLAWNQSDEAMAAVRSALPLLIAAQLVNITVIDPPLHGSERSDPGGALAQYLSRHGVKAEVSVLARTQPNVGDILTRHATEIGADLIVMGAYSHSRLRESILGGATRSLLERPDLPVFMAH